MCKEERHKARNDLGKSRKKFGLDNGYALYNIFKRVVIRFWCGKENGELLNALGKKLLELAMPSNQPKSLTSVCSETLWMSQPSHHGTGTCSAWLPYFLTP